MTESFSRTELILGQAAMERLRGARVVVFGIGGVGGYAVEALARCGVGHIDLVDHDKIERTNLNRQIIATEKTLGRYKVDVMKERIQDVNPQAQVTAHPCFYLPDAPEEIDFTAYSYIIDAVDTVTAKISIITQSQEAGVSVISCMGAGNKLDPSQLKVGDIYQTTVCPLAKVMRRELKKRGVKGLKVVYSTEEPRGRNPQAVVMTSQGNQSARRSVPGSVSFVPSVAGLLMAGEVVKDLCESFLH